MASKVGLYHCPEYDPQKIESILEEAFAENPEWLDGIKAGSRVFLKANLLLKKKPAEAVTTHPALVEAVSRILRKRGARVCIGDSPGGPYLLSRLKSIYRVCGMEEAARRSDAELNLDLSERHVSFPDGKVAKAFDLITPVVEADIVISLPKLKTHQMTKFTGAVKNHFGIIPGLKKADYHIKMPELLDFSEVLVDLALCVKAHLHIMDGIVGMQGHGPSAGDPVQVGAILISQDPFALDVAALELVKIPPQSVPTVLCAGKRGLAGSLQDVELVGRELSQWRVPPFVAPSIRNNARFLVVPEFIHRALRPKPHFLKEKCVRCGECVTCCPAKALIIENGPPQVDLEACIRCFCCQELCPQKAVIVKRHPVGRLLE